MSRSRTRLTVAITLGSVLAAVASPALAVDNLTKVTYVVADGTRQFTVTELDGRTALADFAFGPELTKPFRTLVKDQNRLLASSGYQINAQMTNLYLRQGAGHDFTTFIASKNLSLGYGLNPLAGTSALPVVPRVRLSGGIGTCADASVATALGIAPLALLDILTSSLDPLLKTVCTELGNLSLAVRTVDATVDGAAKTVTAPLALPDLPFALTGAQQTGAFTNPSYLGAVASGDTVGDRTIATTTKRVMTGTPLLPGGNVTGLLSGLTTTLTGLVGATPLVAGDNAGVTTLSAALAAISVSGSPLVTTITKLTPVDQLDLVNLLTDVLKPVDLSALSTVAGEYGAFPVLQASPLATKAGTYDGTMIVDFFETGA